MRRHAWLAGFCTVFFIIGAVEGRFPIGAFVAAVFFSALAFRTAPMPADPQAAEVIAMREQRDWAMARVDEMRKALTKISHFRKENSTPAQHLMECVEMAEEALAWKNK